MSKQHIMPLNQAVWVKYESLKLQGTGKKADVK